ncbi:MAG: 50S ribosomal protein L22 [Kiritimatiellia bacterium]|nr:50S ribosomal protein L22 [Kiritimatiellia bacterium]
MDITSTTKFARISPTKARDLARAIQGKTVAEALRLTEASERKAAFLIRKTLHSAIANAENNHEKTADALVVREAVVDTGPTLKRSQPRSRGMARPIRKRMSHIRIVLTDGQA